MAKGKSQRHSSNASQPARGGPSSADQPTSNTRRRTFFTSPLVQLLRDEHEGLLWLLLCVLMGICLGIGVGTGYFLGGYGQPPTLWRIQLGHRIRNTVVYNTLFRGVSMWSALSPPGSDGTDQLTPEASSSPAFTNWMSHDDENGHDESTNGYDNENPKSLPNTHNLWESISASSLFGRGKPTPLSVTHRSHPRAFYTLREMIIREDGGYVHPDLGLLTPAPCGAERGLGMVSSRYHECQVTCSPGTTSWLSSPPPKPPSNNTNSSNIYQLPKGWYPQEEILLRIPLSIQMTRATALKTLRAIIPVDVQRRAPLEDLDDAILLTLQLAHEHGRGRESRFHPYVATFPLSSTCGYSPVLRAAALDFVASLGATYGLDVNGWPAEIHKAYEYADRIASSLARDYGSYISVAASVQPLSLLQWSLCHVSSRAIGGSELDEDGIPVVGSSKKKSLRLVPLLDMINHDVTAGMVQELYNGNEEGDVAVLELEDQKVYSNIREDEHGTFIVRNMRHGKVLPLAKGQELLINYNVPEYSALDWFLLMAFVPPERMERWVKIESALPRVRVKRPSVGVPTGNDMPQGSAANTPHSEPRQSL